MPIRVQPLPVAKMPENIIGAIALCFASAPNHLIAVSNAAASLKERQYEIIDMAGDVQQLDYERWDEYVASVWPEFLQQMPSQTEVLDYVSKGVVFYGPFCGWEEE